MTLPKDPEKARIYIDNMKSRNRLRASQLPFKERREISKLGYVVIHYRNHPILGTGRFYEHRLVMEEILDRKLEFCEKVHHKDADKTNNNPNNLELLTHKAHLQEHLSGKPVSPHISEAARNYMLSLPFEERRKRGVKGGGNSGPGLKETLSKLTPEQRKERTAAARNAQLGKPRKPHTEAAKLKIGLASKGNQHTKGYHHTGESKLKISEASKRYWASRRDNCDI